jgi:hypothetical protein
MILLGLLAAVVLALPAAAAPGLTTSDLTSGVTPTDLANAMAGPGVTVSNVTYTGANVAAGTFAGGTGIIGFEDGIMLSSGSIGNAIGPNVDDGITTINGTPGDSDLTALAGVGTNDAAVLAFDFVPSANTVSFQYVFASDEYNEFVNKHVQRCVRVFRERDELRGRRQSGRAGLDQHDQQRNPFGTDPRSHPELFRNNDLQDGGGIDRHGNGRSHNGLDLSGERQSKCHQSHEARNRRWE